MSLRIIGGSAVFVAIAVITVAIIPGINHGYSLSVQNETPIATVRSSLGPGVSLNNFTQTSMGFIDKTLVLSNNSLIPGDFLRKGNNSQEPMYVAFDPINGNLYVTIKNTGQIAVVNGTENRIQSHINVGGTPFGIAFDPLNKYIYVTDISSRNVSVINPQNNSVVKNLTVGNNPYAMAFDPQNGNMYVTDSNTTGVPSDNQGTISVINSTTDEVVSNFTIGSDPQGIAYDPANGEMFIAVYGGGYVYAFNFQSGGIYLIRGSSTYYIGGQPYYIETPSTLSYNPLNQLMYIGDVFTGNVLGVNSSNQVVSSVREGVQNSMFYDSVNGYTYVVNGIRGIYGEVSAINPATNRQVGSIWIGNYPNGFAAGSAFDEENGLFYVTNSVAGTLVIFQSTGPSSVIFRAVGFIGGAQWSVTFGGVEAQSTSNTIQFNQQNGTYSYTVQEYGAYFPLSATQGNVSTGNGTVVVTVYFISDYILIASIVGIPTLLAVLAYVLLIRKMKA